MVELLRRVVRPAGRRAASLVTARWPARSRLFLVGEGVNWSIDLDLRELGARAAPLGIRIGEPRLLHASSGQAAFYGSQFTLLREPWRPPPHALATAYFHGRPGTPGMPEFDECYEVLRRHHDRLERIQVSHSEIEELVLSTGIDLAKVFRIPIGVDAALFAPVGGAGRAAARETLGLPQQAFVVGSFQKDGVGFGDGAEPKAIKGPDVLLDALAALHARVPELHVLLSGIARGFVRAGLERLGIPYRHVLRDRYEDVAPLYGALDAYVVPSRQEGGPKGLLEAMAAGVPVVTTRVGQAMDVVRHGENAWMVEVDDAEGLAHWLAHVAAGGPDVAAVTAAGLETAAAHDYDRLVPLWKRFMDGFVLRRP